MLSEHASWKVLELNINAFIVAILSLQKMYEKVIF